MPGVVAPNAAVALSTPDEFGSRSFARPKSRIFTYPSRVIMTLSGLRSR
jgi:hypothetical protein